MIDSNPMCHDQTKPGTRRKYVSKLSLSETRSSRRIELQKQRKWRYPLNGCLKSRYHYSCKVTRIRRFCSVINALVLTLAVHCTLAVQLDRWRGWIILAWYVCQIYFGCFTDCNDLPRSG